MSHFFDSHKKNGTRSCCNEDKLTREKLEKIRHFKSHPFKKEAVTLFVADQCIEISKIFSRKNHKQKQNYPTANDEVFRLMSLFEVQKTKNAKSY